MENIDLHRNLQALQGFYPRNIEGRLQRLPLGELEMLPVWIKGVIQIFELPLLGVPHEPFLYLALPEQDMAFEHLVRIYRHLVEKFKAPVLIIADNLPPKHRPLLVKFNIAFIYKNESVYAPELGLKFGKIRRFRETQSPDIENKKEAVTPFGLKLIAGLLTNQILPEFTLKYLHQKIRGEDVKASMTKLSITLNELVTHGLLLARGGGPTRHFIKIEVKKTWERILGLPLMPFFREARTNRAPKNQETFCLAGETALAQCSNLAAPATATVAMSVGDFKKYYKGGKEEILFDDLQAPSIIQIWKEPPQLFSIRGAMNPIEVFFAMRNHPDERVQMSLNEMLEPYGLRRKEI